jgi:hypothetical protein
MRSELDTGMLTAALAGYQSRLAELNARIKELREYLAAHSTGLIPRKKHNVSPEGRARIAAAQRRRWAKMKARSVTPAA